MTYNIIAIITHSLTEIAAGDANTVYAMLMKVLTDYDLPIAKIIGICSDGANTMQGVHKGVCVQLAKYIRELRQVYISDIIARDDFNGPSVTEFAELLDFESRQPHWPLYIPPTNFRV